MDEGVERVTLADVAGVGVEAAPQRAHLGACCAAVRLHVLADADDVRARLGQRQRDGLADTAPAAGDQRGLAIKAEQVRPGTFISPAGLQDNASGWYPCALAGASVWLAQGRGKESRMLCKSLMTAAIALRRALLMAHGKNRHGLGCGDFACLLPNLRLRS